MGTTITPIEYRLDRETVGELNVDMIFNLIKWAEQDEAYLDRFINWGRWNQGLWAETNVPESLISAAGRIEDMTALRQEILNGACGTSYCMAGQAAFQSGYRLRYNTYVSTLGGNTVSADTCIRQVETGEKDKYGRPVTKDAPGAYAESISEVAKRVLQITEAEADRFFEGENELPDLRSYANGMCARRGLPLMFPDAEPYDFDDEY